MEAIPGTLKLPEAKLQLAVAKVIGVSPFSAEVLNLTLPQMIWILKSAQPETGASEYEDPDFESSMQELLGE